MWKHSPDPFSLVFFICFLTWENTVPFRHGERIGFSYLVSQKYTGDTALVKVLRDSKILQFDIKLATHKRLIPAHTSGKPPSYYIIAGFVFTSVTVPYFRSEVCSDLTLSFFLSMYVCFLFKSVIVIIGHCLNAQQVFVLVFFFLFLSCLCCIFEKLDC